MFEKQEPIGFWLKDILWQTRYFIRKYAYIKFYNVGNIMHKNDYCCDMKCSKFAALDWWHETKKKIQKAKTILFIKANK